MQINQEKLNSLMRISPSELVSFILGIVAESCSKKITDELKGAWSLTLDGIPNNYLIKGFQILMKEKTDNFMPHPGELRGICRGIQIANRREKRSDSQDQTLIDYSNIPLIAEQAKKIVDKTKTKTPVKFPTIGLEETIDPRTGETRKLVTRGHIGHDFFKEQCYCRHLIRPYTVKHEYRSWTEFKDKDINGNFLRSSHGYAFCVASTKEAESVTIGYF